MCQITSEIVAIPLSSTACQTRLRAISISIENPLRREDSRAEIREITPGYSFYDVIFIYSLASAVMRTL